MPIDFDKLESIQRKSTYAPKDKYKDLLLILMLIV